MASSLANRIADVLLGIFKTFVCLAILGILFIVFFGGHGGTIDSVRKAQAKNDVAQIAAAITAFQTEYNRLPSTNSGPVGGDLVETLLGKNKTTNPRQIVFLEIQSAKTGKSGVTNGTFVDPWGGAYQIAFASGTNTTVVGGTNNIKVHQRVAIWNDPRLEKLKPRWFSSEKPKSRYVTSWIIQNP